MKRLDGKVVLVTGGTRGIGEAITRLFASEGAVVAFCGRSDNAGVEIEADVRGAGGIAEFTACDVSSADQVAAWVDGVAARHGRIDALVNNAARMAVGPLEEMTLEEWESMFRTNVTSMFLVTKRAIPHLRNNGGGNILNLGSTYGLVAAADCVAYCVTKAAAVSLSKGLALELMSDGIRVNALCPAGTTTAFSEWAFDNSGDPIAARVDAIATHPMGRFATPEEQARAALFLVSDDASYVTGHAMLVDGGYTAQ
ncbi:MAG TPA: glucose 1-dehydrogenase [Gaiellaceae bacterium]